MKNLTRNEELIIEELFQMKADDSRDTEAYVTTVEPVTLRKWNGHGEEDTLVEIDPGQTLRIVMISYMGDFGLTDDLSASRNYHLRLSFASDKICNIRLKP